MNRATIPPAPPIHVEIRFEREISTFLASTPSIRANTDQAILRMSLDLPSGFINNAGNNTRQGYARKRTLKPAGYLFLGMRVMERIFIKLTTIYAELADLLCQHGMKIKGEPGASDFGFNQWLTNGQCLADTMLNTPAMPLHDAHFGGFFVSGVCQ